MENHITGEKNVYRWIKCCSSQCSCLIFAFFFFLRNMSRVNPVTLSDKMSQLERGPLFKSDFRQICSVHRSSELSCTFYPELFPSTILSNHLHYSKIMWSDSTVTPPSPKSKKITKFHSQMGYYIQGQNDSWKCQRNLKKKITWSHTSFINKLMIPCLRITGFHWFSNMLTLFSGSGCDVYCHSNSHQV